MGERASGTARCAALANGLTWCQCACKPVCSTERVDSIDDGGLICVARPTWLAFHALQICRSAEPVSDASTHRTCRAGQAALGDIGVHDAWSMVVAILGLHPKP